MGRVILAGAVVLFAAAVFYMNYRIYADCRESGGTPVHGVFTLECMRCAR